MIYYSHEVIPQFTLREAKCKCGCGLIILQHDLLMMLHHVRLRYNKPIVVESWTRCESHNREVDGVPNSYHLFGKAVDIRPLKFELLNGGFIGICKEYFPYVELSRGYLHCDMRGPRHL